MGDENLNENIVLQKYDRYVFEYEKRFITSISVTAAAAMVFCFTSSRFTDDADRFLISMLPSLWAFLVALVSSGSVPLLKSKQYQSLRDSVYTSARCKLIMQDKEDDFFPSLNKRDRVYILKKYSERDFEVSQYWKWGTRTAIGVALAALLFGVSWPLFLLTFYGYI